MNNEAPWITMAPNQSSPLPEPHLKQLIFQYDFMRPFLRSAKVHKRDQALEILDTADKLIILTIWHSPDVLQEAWARNQIAQKTKLGVFLGKKRDRLLQKELNDPSKIRGFYKSWFEFAHTKTKNHLIVCLENGIHRYTPEEWEELTLPYEKKD